MTAYSASNPPDYVYKIIPSPSVNPRYAFPIPVPASHEFVLSELDARDGFIHMSTRPQVAGTLNRFFPNDPSVVLVKIGYARLNGFKVVKWENGYPHLYRTLEGEYVESVQELSRDSSKDVEGDDKGKGSWDSALAKLSESGWFV
ncbi:hypothetical protein JCM10212_006592 [Sporobolomyces blumeae]